MPAQRAAGRERRGQAGRDRAGGGTPLRLGTVTGGPATGPFPLSRQIQEMATSTSRFLSGLVSTSMQSHSKSNIPFLAPKQSRSAGGRAAAGGGAAGALRAGPSVVHGPLPPSAVGPSPPRE